MDELQAPPCRIEPGTQPAAPRVFISYSHDTPAHGQRVCELADRLRGDGFVCIIDAQIEAPPEGWAQWTLREVRGASLVLVVCTDTYRRRFEGEEIPGIGKGAKWEGAIITQLLYESEGWNTVFVPVIFSSGDADCIPLILKGATAYALDSEEGYRRLLRRVRQQPGAAMAPTAGPRCRRPPPDGAEQRNLVLLRDRVRQFWIEGVLEESLQGAALIAVGKEQRSDAVEHPWEQVLALPGRAFAPVPAARTIEEIFEESAHALLILGEAGSGKSTTLLELARSLIVRAETSAAEPVPVILNLSSWSPQRAFRDWLAAEIAGKYYVARRMVGSWIEQQRLTLLLDGLDEVASGNRAGCIEAINAFVEEHGTPGLAVCSRLAEYTALPVRLRLQGAIALQPLSPGQVGEFIEHAGCRLASLGAALREDEALRGLAQSPLMLSVMILAYDGASAIASGAGSVEQRRRQVFEAYVQRMFERSGRRELRYSPAETRSWLSNLARGMQRGAQSLFLIEQLQPAWLSSAARRWAYVICSRVVAGLCLGASSYMFGHGWVKFGRPSGMGAALPGEMLTASDCLLIGGVFGLGVALVDGVRLAKGRLLSRALRGWTAAWMIPFYWMTAALLCWRLTGRAEWFASGIEWAPLFGLRSPQVRAGHDLRTVELLRWSWRGATKGFAIGALASVVLAGVAAVAWATLPVRGTYVLESGGRSIAIPAMVCVLLGFIFAMPGVALITTVFGGLRRGIVETKVTPNEGMRSSVRNALFGGLVVALPGVVAMMVVPCAVAMGLVPGLSASHGIPGVLKLLVLTGQYLFLLAAFWYGGLDVIQHWTLRLLLSGARTLPRRLVVFLDHATQLVFLRKIGGGYMFVHRLLLEHFAALRA